MKQMTIEKLSERSGLDDKFISKVERGKAGFTMFTLFRLASGLNLNSPVELLSDASKEIYPKFRDAGD